MTWLKLTSEALYLMEGGSSKAKDEVKVDKIDADTLALDVPLDWMRASDSPGQMIIALKAGTPPSSSAISTSSWKDFYAGLDLNGSQIPRKGLSNPTLGSTLGVNQEPFGNIVQFDGLDFVQGKVSWFGGPQDDGVADDETGSLTGENLKKLPENDYYCAMRWSFSPNGTRFWANQRILVINPLNQKAVIVRAIDWGPNTSTKRILDLSPKALEDLSAETDDDLLVAFAQPNSQPVGPV